MTMRLAVGRATVVTPDGSQHRSMVVLSRFGKLTVQSRMGVEVVDTTATAVRITDPSRGWEVDTPEGVYTVTREGGCGCGG